MTKRRKGVPLIPPANKSRKQARKITTLFHKYTRQRDAALARGDEKQVEELKRDIDEMGGREAYQKASQVSTSFFSTSKKWVLGVLGRNGWLYGIALEGRSTSSGDQNTRKKDDDTPEWRPRKRKRRPTQLLEIGAINTDLAVDAVQKYPQLAVRAIDLNAIHPSIEEGDFLTIPFDHTYDVLVCSMVLNCVTTAPDRGRMVLRLAEFLRLQGLLFLTIPKSCLTQSPYTSRQTFLQLLHDTGFDVLEDKDTPRIAFFLCRKAREPDIGDRWKECKRIFRGKKFRNDFAVSIRPADLKECR